MSTDQEQEALIRRLRSSHSFAIDLNQLLDEIGDDYSKNIKEKLNMLVAHYIRTNLPGFEGMPAVRFDLYTQICWDRPHPKRS